MSHHPYRDLTAEADEARKMLVEDPTMFIVYYGRETYDRWIAYEEAMRQLDRDLESHADPLE